VEQPPEAPSCSVRAGWQARWLSVQFDGWMFFVQLGVQLAVCPVGAEIQTELAPL
jgi:hypothetical protein